MSNFSLDYFRLGLSNNRDISSLPLIEYNFTQPLKRKYPKRLLFTIFVYAVSSPDTYW
jgi:hypothetical protein